MFVTNAVGCVIRGRPYFVDMDVSVFVEVVGLFNVVLGLRIFYVEVIGCKLLFSIISVLELLFSRDGALQGSYIHFRTFHFDLLSPVRCNDTRRQTPIVADA